MHAQTRARTGNSLPDGSRRRGAARDPAPRGVVLFSKPQASRSWLVATSEAPKQGRKARRQPSSHVRMRGGVHDNMQCSPLR